MKKVRLLGLLLAFAAVLVVRPVHAQGFGNSYTFPLIAGDTLNNTDTVFKGFTATAGYRDIGIQVLVNKISGTVAGKLILMCSMDGYNYTPTDSMSYLAAQTASAYTPTATNDAWVWKTGSPFTHYMILCTSSGTVSAQVTVKLTQRRTQVSITP